MRRCCAGCASLYTIEDYHIPQFVTEQTHARVKVIILQVAAYSCDTVVPSTLAGLGETPVRTARIICYNILLPDCRNQKRGNIKILYFEVLH